NNERREKHKFCPPVQNLSVGSRIMKRKRNPQSCDSCRKDKKRCSGGENGVNLCNRCRNIGKDCSYLEEIGPLEGHCENHPGFENANDDISYLQNIPNELLPNYNILYPQDGFIDSDGSSEYYGFGNLANSPHNTSQTNMAQEHQYPQYLTSPTLNEYLKNLLMKLQSESSQMEKISGGQANNLELSPLDQLS
ncbi:25192_t:CDS:2, partial [Dentiscutata erythropus]